VKRFLPFVLAIVGTMLALGLTFLVLRTDLLPIRQRPEVTQGEAPE
jgi:hypothetical protein